MAAGFTTYKMSGASGGALSSATFATETHMGNKDNLTSISSQMAVGVPETGTAYSYELWVRTKCSRAPRNNAYDFCIWYQGTDPAVGCKLYGGSASAYTTPSINKSTKAINDMFQYTSIGDSLAFGGHVNAVGSSFPYIILQYMVTPQATYGAQTPMVLHYSYKEN